MTERKIESLDDAEVQAGPKRARHALSRLEKAGPLFVAIDEATDGLFPVELVEMIGKLLGAYSGVWIAAEVQPNAPVERVLEAQRMWTEITLVPPPLYAVTRESALKGWLQDTNQPGCNWLLVAIKLSWLDADGTGIQPGSPSPVPCAFHIDSADTPLWRLLPEECRGKRGLHVAVTSCIFEEGTAWCHVAGEAAAAPIDLCRPTFPIDDVRGRYLEIPKEAKGLIDATIDCARLDGCHATPFTIRTAFTYRATGNPSVFFSGREAPIRQGLLPTGRSLQGLLEIASSRGHMLSVGCIEVPLTKGIQTMPRNGRTVLKSGFIMASSDVHYDECVLLAGACGGRIDESSEEPDIVAGESHQPHFYTRVQFGSAPLVLNAQWTRGAFAAPGYEYEGGNVLFERTESKALDYSLTTGYWASGTITELTHSTMSDAVKTSATSRTVPPRGRDVFLRPLFEACGRIGTLPIPADACLGSMRAVRRIRDLFARFAVSRSDKLGVSHPLPKKVQQALQTSDFRRKEFVTVVSHLSKWWNA